MVKKHSIDQESEVKDGEDGCVTARKTRSQTHFTNQTNVVNGDVDDFVEEIHRRPRRSCAKIQIKAESEEDISDENYTHREIDNKNDSRERLSRSSRRNQRRRDHHSEEETDSELGRMKPSSAHHRGVELDESRGTRRSHHHRKEESADETDDDDYRSRRLRHRRSDRKESKSVHVSHIPAEPARSSPRRGSIKKPKRYIESDDEDIEDMTYENLSRGRYDQPRRRNSTPIAAQPVSRGSNRHHYNHRRGESYKDTRSREDRYDEEPRRSGRQRKLLYDTFNQSLIAMMNHAEETRTESNKDDSMEIVNQPAVNEPPRKKRQREVDPMPEADMDDMYARIKRTRRQVKQDMYGLPVTEEEKSEGEGDAADSESETEDDAAKPKRRSYSLREHRPRPQILEINWEEGKRKKHFEGVFSRDRTPPRHKKKNDKRIYRSPARKKHKFRRRKAAFHGSDSTSSSGSSSGGDSSDDERRFERRKAKSMAASRQKCLPMNFSQEDVMKTGVIRDRTRIGASLADIDPMSVDSKVTFDSVGGLGKHIRALKEMIVFPLLYPEVFERFKIQPPRGCLFYGPPGTGKTLVARALANECSSGEKKVAFFMRKGADCLSKWVGESERQLRLLFDQAYQMRPSILFFDEIDGLAPVRSSRQDQIHSSIVSTLLALMDGLDNRGEIVVIGATNRLDSIDPALRRPGRFDREFHFPLPSVEARKQILQIHTNAWNPKLSESFLAELAEKCGGYCGADLKALCTEAALHALRRRYPQIYTSQDKLQLDVSSINVNARDFHHGMQCIVPASQRSVTSPARALTPAIRPLLRASLDRTLQALQKMFPSVLTQLSSLDAPAGTNSTGDGGGDMLASDSDDDSPDIFIGGNKRNRRKSGGSSELSGPFMNFTTHAYQRPATHRPRMLLTGSEGQGQSTHLAPAVLHSLERLPVHTLDLPTLYANSAKTPEESCAQIFREAKRTSPSIIYMPHLCRWWEVAGDACRATFMSLLCDMEPSAPTLLLATAEMPYVMVPNQVQEMFSMGAGEVVVMQNPTDSERREFFEDLLIKQATKPPSTKRKAAERMLEQLPKAPKPKARELTESELARLREIEEATLREMRLFLRDVLNKLGRDRKFQIFAKPVDAEEVPDYYEIITNPMDLSTMMSKIDLCKYETVGDFLKDIDLICRNALEYNPDHTLMGRAIRHRACALRDLAQATVDQELDKDFEKYCCEIKQARKNRGESPQKNIPDFFFTKRVSRNTLKSLRVDPTSLGIDPSALPASSSNPSSARRSGRLTRQNYIESRQNPNDSTGECDSPLENEETPEIVEINGVKYQKVVRRERMKRKPLPQNMSIWCKPNKKRFANVAYYIDEQGKEHTHNDLFQLDEKDEEENEGTSQDTNDCKTESQQDDVGSTANAQDQSQDKDEENDTQPKEGTDEANARSDPQLDLLTVDTNLNDPEAEKENKPSPCHSPRDRSKSPRASGHISPRTQSNTRRPRSKSPRDETAQTRSPRKSPRRISPRNRSPIKHSAEKKKRGSTGHEKKVEEISEEKHKVKINISTPTQDDSCAPAAMDTESPKQGANTPCVDGPARNKDEHNKSHNEEDMDTGGSSKNTRVTRSRVHGSKQVERAVEILHEQVQNVTVDVTRLHALLDKVVERSRGYKVETLERLYSVLSQCIYHHRTEYDKTQLITELESSLDQFTKCNRT